MCYCSVRADSGFVAGQVFDNAADGANVLEIGTMPVQHTSIAIGAVKVSHRNHRMNV